MHKIFQQKSNENNDMGSNYHKRSNSRSKSSSHVVPSPITILDKNDNTRMVRIRLVFIRIGDIDTLNEKYQADVYYEARWKETMNINLLNLNSEQQSQLLNEHIAVKVNDLNRTKTNDSSPNKIKDLNSMNNWTPQLFIENAIGPISEEKWFTIKKNIEENLGALSPPIVNLYLCEHHRVKGLFWEKLELNHFPADVQDLTISITTQHHIETCILIPDENLRSSINREAFSDQQEWILYEHVATEMRQTQEEYSFHDENQENRQQKHSVLAVTCRAARRPGYYYWNGFCLIFLITVCSFCIFSIPPDFPQSRLQITCTLLLTSVTFRWVVNRSLPTISYLTTLDKYAIISIVILVLLCVWHSVIAVIIFLNPETLSSKSIGPNNLYVNIDRYIFIFMFIIYIIMHISLVVWLIFVPYKRRREMEYLDREYAAQHHIRLETKRVRYNSIQMQPQDIAFRRSSSINGSLSILKSPTRFIKPSSGVKIIANASTFIPIQEETSSKTSDIIELNEQDDVFYDHTNNINNELKNT